MKKELFIKTKIYNNLLREARLEAGYESCLALGKEIYPNSSPGKQAYVAELESFSRSPLRMSPVSKEYSWRKAAIDIANFLNKDPEQLWPPEFRNISGVKPIFKEISIDEARQLVQGFNFKSLPDPNPGPEQQYEMKELKQLVEQSLEVLTPREQRVIRMRFGIGEEEHTLEELGQDFEVQRERIRQIEMKALKKIRARKKIKEQLKQFWEGRSDERPNS